MRAAFFGFFLSLLLSLSAQQSAPQKKAPSETAPKAPAEAAAPANAPEPAKPPAPLPPPREVRQYNYSYDLSDRPAPSSPAVQEDRRGAGPAAVVDRRETIRGMEGRPVTVRSSEERVLSEQEGDRTSERLVQRYDPSGKPTSKQLVRVERRKTPEGSVVTTETLYDQDLNGRMQFTERRTTTEKKSDSGAAATVLVERPAINGGTQVVERTDRTQTKRNDAVTETISSRQFLDGNGRFQEREREDGVVTKSGTVTTTETKQWQVGAVLGQMDFVSRSVGRLTEAPDGSQVEDVEVYSTKIAGTTPDLNQPQVPTLEQQVHREKKVHPDGKIVETTSQRLRQVAEPSRLGGLVVVEQVTTPTLEGKTIQKTISERDANGKLRRVRSEVEEEKK